MPGSMRARRRRDLFSLSRLRGRVGVGVLPRIRTRGEPPPHQFSPQGGESRPVVDYRPSLRANGSRERAPDDRLREAIHRATPRKNGLLRRFASRNDVDRHIFAFPRRNAPEVCVKFHALESEGAGKAGCTPHPRSRVQKMCKKRTRAYRFSGGNPAFPAQWFYGLLRALPGDRACLTPSLRG
jgi:hypothetical protein